ncbi:hypothetical protein GCM10009818_29300 [Nakamurella flavida]
MKNIRATNGTSRVDTFLMVDLSTEVFAARSTMTPGMYAAPAALLTGTDGPMPPVEEPAGRDLETAAAQVCRLRKR